MSVFVDSSAFVKRYVPETGADAVAALSGPLVIAMVTRVEVAAALAHKQRMGELAAADAATLLSAVSFDVADPELVAVVRLDAAVVDAAVALVGRYGLRGYDAVQLASATVARRGEPGIDTFACFDRDLARAAVAEGFAVVPTPT